MAGTLLWKVLHPCTAILIFLKTRWGVSEETGDSLLKRLQAENNTLPHTYSALAHSESQKGKLFFFHMWMEVWEILNDTFQ